MDLNSAGNPALIQAVIVNFGDCGDAYELARQIARFREEKHRLPSLEVWIWDNGGNHPIDSSAGLPHADVRIDGDGTNLGYAAALNEFVRRRQREGRLGEALWVLNPDVSVTGDALARLWDVLLTRPVCGAVGGEIRKGSATGPVWGARGGVSPLAGVTWMSPWPRKDALPRWSYLPGCSPLIRTSAWIGVGGMREDYFLYFEETDFCVRLQRKGWEIWVDPAARIIHRVDSLQDGLPRPHFVYYFIRNQFLFWKSCFRISPWLQLPRTCLVALRELVIPHLRRGAYRRLLLTLWRDFRPAVADGIAGRRGPRVASGGSA